MSERYTAASISSICLRMAMWVEPCRVCHLAHTLYRDGNNLPLCLACARVQAAWDALQSVPAYTERKQS